MLKRILFPAVVMMALISACSKSTDNFKPVTVSDYAPLQVGKYITYQLDSVRYLPFTLTKVTFSYQVKFTVDGEITDNLGRPAYRIVRQIRVNPTDPWVNDNSFAAIEANNRYEYTDNNLRFVKLVSPVQDGITWKGNAYINTTSQYSEFPYLLDWDYMYDSVGAPLTLGSVTLDNTIKVAQRDEVIGNPDDPNSYSEINFGEEYYAKGIGLVYKKIFHSEYQPPTTVGAIGSYSSDSKGYTLTMIDHN